MHFNEISKRYTRRYLANFGFDVGTKTIQKNKKRKRRTAAEKISWTEIHKFDN